MTRFTHGDGLRTRRAFLGEMAAGAGLLLAAPLAGCARNLTSAGMLLPGATRGWDMVPAILARIRPPVFPSRTFDVMRYGAVADGRTDASAAFRSAIEACSAAGGGRVLAAGGAFAVGPITLRSNVELHVAEGATLLFSTDPARYLPAVKTRFEGVELMGYSPLIYAHAAENVAVTGAGTLDGQAGPEHWWPWKGSAEHGYVQGGPTQKGARDRLVEMGERGVPVAQRVFGDGSFLRPQFIQPYECRNVLIEGVTITRSPMWEIHPVLCQNVTVRGVTIESMGPNNDGCDPESCRDVLIENCRFTTGDDCIAIKSGRNGDGRRLQVPSENIIVRGCHMQDGHGGVTIGSEISGDVRNVFVERCHMDSANLDRALRLKNNAMRGGTLEHIYMRDVEIGQVGEAVLAIDFFYEEGANGPFVPVVRDVELLRVTSRKSHYDVYLRGTPGSTIADIRVVDCDFANVAKGSVADNVTGLSWRNSRVNGVLKS